MFELLLEVQIESGSFKHLTIPVDLWYQKENTLWLRNLTNSVDANADVSCRTCDVSSPFTEVSI